MRAQPTFEPREHPPALSNRRRPQPALTQVSEVPLDKLPDGPLDWTATHTASVQPATRRLGGEVEAIAASCELAGRRNSTRRLLRRVARNAEQPRDLGRRALPTVREQEVDPLPQRRVTRRCHLVASASSQRRRPSRRCTDQSISMRSNAPAKSHISRGVPWSGQRAFGSRSGRACSITLASVPCRVDKLLDKATSAYDDQVPELVAAAEIAALLGVSRQRVYQLIQENETFPEPVEELTVGRIWRRADVEKWARRAGRL